MSLGYLALEVRRTLRAPGTLLFTIGFPAVFYLLEVVLYAGYELPAGAVGWPTILMVSMNAWGVLMAGLLVGSRVVHERAAGWQRQLRLTPLSGGGYLLGKAAVGQLVAAPTALAVPLVAVLVRRRPTRRRRLAARDAAALGRRDPVRAPRPADRPASDHGQRPVAHDGRDAAAGALRRPLHPRRVRPRVVGRRRPAGPELLAGRDRPSGDRARGQRADGGRGARRVDRGARRGGGLALPP